MAATSLVNDTGVNFKLETAVGVARVDKGNRNDCEKTIICLIDRFYFISNDNSGSIASETPVDVGG